MENTRENKMKFFAQYWGQEVSINPFHGIGGVYLTTVSPETMYDYGKPSHNCLLLKPLSSITDEDAGKLAQIILGRYSENAGKDLAEDIDYNNYVTEIIDSIPGSFGLEDVSQTFDYLRSKGYALPWNGISVEQQVEYCWIKLQDL